MSLYVFNRKFYALQKRSLYVLPYELYFYQLQPKREQLFNWETKIMFGKLYIAKKRRKHSTPPFRNELLLVVLLVYSASTHGCTKIQK